jgi:hypothetical protein
MAVWSMIQSWVSLLMPVRNRQIFSALPVFYLVDEGTITLVTA